MYGLDKMDTIQLLHDLNRIHWFAPPSAEEYIEVIMEEVHDELYGNFTTFRDPYLALEYRLRGLASRVMTSPYARETVQGMLNDVKAMGALLRRLTKRGCTAPGLPWPPPLPQTPSSASSPCAFGARHLCGSQSAGAGTPCG